MADLDPTAVPGSVYYIHPSDATNKTLVSDVFDGNGFGEWKRSILLSLSSRNKLGFIDGSLVQPSSTDANYKAWCRCNDLVLGWLLFALEKSIAKSVWYCKTAKDLWDDLEERFGHTSATQQYALYQQLAELQHGSTEPVSVFFTKIKSIWDEMDSNEPLPICSCAACTCLITKKMLKIQQDQRLMMFLMKLNDKYAMVRTNILMMQPLPTISIAYRLCMQEEKHKEMSAGTLVTNEPMAFAVGRRFNDRPFDRNFKQQNPAGIFSGNKNGNKNQNIAVGTKRQWFCDHCKMHGHGIERCFKLRGYPPGWNVWNNSKDSGQSTFTQNNKRTANFSQADSDLDNTQGDNSVDEVITPQMAMEQCHKMMNMLVKQQQLQESEKRDNSTANIHNGSALFAGASLLMKSQSIISMKQIMLVT